MKEKRDSKNFVIGALLVAVVFMAVGYAALSSTLTINGTAKLEAASWNVNISNVALNASESTGTYVENGDITVTGTTASFDATLSQPGTSVVYDITVANTGSLAATRTGFDPTKAATLSVTGADTKYVTVSLVASESSDALAATTGVHHYKLTITYPNVNNASDLPTTALTYSVTANFTYEQAV